MPPGDEAPGDGTAGAGGADPDPSSDGSRRPRTAERLADPDTLLVTPLPARVTTTSLRIHFGAEPQRAEQTFLCRFQNEPEQECADGRYVAHGLVHGRSYTLEVRAQQGSRIDPTPLRVSFYVDLLQNYEQLRGAVLQPERVEPEVLPQAVISESGEVTGGAPPRDDRLMMLGQSAILKVPAMMRVSSWGTSLTYNGQLRVVHERWRASCPNGFRDELFDERHLCVAYLSRDHHREAFGGRLPYDHVRLNAGHTTDHNQWMFAAPVTADDPGWAELGLPGQCFLHSGTRQLTTHRRSLAGGLRWEVAWCYRPGPLGVGRWFVLAKTAADADRQLGIIHARRHHPGLISGAHVARDVMADLEQMVVVAPTSG